MHKRKTKCPEPKNIETTSSGDALILIEVSLQRPRKNVQERFMRLPTTLRHLASLAAK
jgi:hypothetical protein